jgi:hypothetical protein
MLKMLNRVFPLDRKILDILARLSAIPKIAPHLLDLPVGVTTGTGT